MNSSVSQMCAITSYSYRNIVILLIYSVLLQIVSGCNEGVCISVVSKCLLLKSCMCTSDDHGCHKNCFECLDKQNFECCPCFEFCPKPKPSVLQDQSTVERFSETVPGLFRALTEYPDDRWVVSTHSLKVHFPEASSRNDIAFFREPSKEFKNNVAQIQLNCTVVYLQNCLSWSKCRKNCLTMGASSCRWFHDGCCQCVGDQCPDYGLAEGRCENCPAEEFSENMEIEEDDDYDYDYNE